MTSNVQQIERLSALLNRTQQVIDRETFSKTNRKKYSRCFKQIKHDIINKYNIGTIKGHPYGDPLIPYTEMRALNIVRQGGWKSLQHQMLRIKYGTSGGVKSYTELLDVLGFAKILFKWITPRNKGYKRLKRHFDQAKRKVAYVDKSIGINIKMGDNPKWVTIYL